MENKFIKINNENDWSEYTFLFASVSVGNIGQLAVDLLISSLSNTHKCGYFISNLVHPIVGHNAFVQKSSDISLSCECIFIFIQFFIQILINKFKCMKIQI